MKTESIKIKARDGYYLSARLFSPEENDSQIIVQIHCGTGIPQKLYANLAEHLALNGIAAVTFDYRGVAESAPESLKGFHAEIADWGKEDMAGVFDWVIDNFPDHKKVIVGHSMGGQLIGLMPNHKKIDQIFMIASSTGYWRDMNNPYKWVTFFFWYFLIPLHTRVYGYVNAMKVRQGENLPKAVALQWRTWCTDPAYFEPALEGSLSPNFFEEISMRIKAIRIEDDPLANLTTFSKILRFYKNADFDIETIVPKDYGLEKVGHTGFFSRKMRSRWDQLVEEIKT